MLQRVGSVCVFGQKKNRLRSALTPFWFCHALRIELVEMKNVVGLKRTLLLQIVLTVPEHSPHTGAFYFLFFLGKAFLN